MPRGLIVDAALHLPVPVIRSRPYARVRVSLCMGESNWTETIGANRSMWPKAFRDSGDSQLSLVRKLFRTESNQIRFLLTMID